MASNVQGVTSNLISLLSLPIIFGISFVAALSLILGGLFGVLGALLIYLGVQVTSIGQGFEVTNVGVLFLFIAAIIVIATLERVLKSIHDFNVRQGVNLLQR